MNCDDQLWNCRTNFTMDWTQCLEMKYRSRTRTTFFPSSLRNRRLLGKEAIPSVLRLPPGYNTGRGSDGESEQSSPPETPSDILTPSSQGSAVSFEWDDDDVFEEPLTPSTSTSTAMLNSQLNSDLLRTIEKGKFAEMKEKPGKSPNFCKRFVDWLRYRKQGKNGKGELCSTSSPDGEELNDGSADRLQSPDTTPGHQPRMLSARRSEPTNFLSAISRTTSQSRASSMMGLANHNATRRLSTFPAEKAFLTSPDHKNQNVSPGTKYRSERARMLASLVSEFRRSSDLINVGGLVSRRHRVAKYKPDPLDGNFFGVTAPPNETKLYPEGRPIINPDEPPASSGTWPLDLQSVLVTCDCDFEARTQGSEEEIREGIKHMDRHYKRCAACKLLGQDVLVPWRNVLLGETVCVGREVTVMRGWMHGEVTVFTQASGTFAEERKFWQDVRSLAKIRHENVTLFMGACAGPWITPDGETTRKLGLIMAYEQGVTLHEHIFVRGSPIPLQSKINIARQVAQALGYLHSRGIMHKKLNSQNVFVESKVRISLVDVSAPKKVYDRTHIGCIPRGHLAYFSPDVVRDAFVKPPAVRLEAPSDFTTDSFAFGTLLYEMLTLTNPAREVPTQTYIYLCGTGIMPMQALSELHSSCGLKDLIGQCWSQNPDRRPNMLEIAFELQQNVSLARLHSTSEPDNLHRFGIALEEKIKCPY